MDAWHDCRFIFFPQNKAGVSYIESITRLLFQYYTTVLSIDANSNAEKNTTTRRYY